MKSTRARIAETWLYDWERNGDDNMRGGGRQITYHIYCLLRMWNCLSNFDQNTNLCLWWTPGDPFTNVV